jgi:hypothetical protein
MRTYILVWDELNVSVWRRPVCWILGHEYKLYDVEGLRLIATAAEVNGVSRSMKELLRECRQLAHRCQRCGKFE